MTAKTKKRAYHRGNVREDLIDAALAMLRTEGISGLSLNKMAQSIGVSTPAAYNHFRNKEDLLAAVAVYGFNRLAAIQGRILARTAAKDRTAALSLAYLKFAMDEPNLYRLMFRHEISNRQDYPDLERAENETFGLSARLYHPDYDPARRSQDFPKAFLLWATLHGIATLIADEQVKVRNRRDLDQLVRIVVEGLPHDN